MCCGGGSSNQQTSTSTNSLPSGISDRLTQVLDRGIDASHAPYQGYDGQRVAGWNGNDTAGQNMAVAASQYGQGAVNSGIGAAQGVAGFNPGMIGAYNVESQQIGAQPAVTAQQVTPQMLRDTDLSKYENPFTQDVIDRSMAELNRQQTQTMQDNSGRAALAGAFGGDRAAIVDAESQRNYLQQKASTIAGLYSQNFQQAQGAATGDISRGLSAAQGNQSAALSAAQGNQASNLQRLTSNQQAALQASLADQQNNFQTQAANQNAGISAAGLRLSAAGTLGSLGEQQQGMGLRGAQAVMGIGAQQRAMDQANLDVGYQNFQEQRQYPWSQVNNLAGIVNGFPTSAYATSTTSSPGPSMISQIGGLGTAGVGAYALGHAASMWKDGGLIPGYKVGGDVDGYYGFSTDALNDLASQGDTDALGELDRRERGPSATNFPVLPPPPVQGPPIGNHVPEPGAQPDVFRGTGIAAQPTFAREVQGPLPPPYVPEPDAPRDQFAGTGIAAAKPEFTREDQGPPMAYVAEPGAPTDQFAGTGIAAAPPTFAREEQGPPMAGYVPEPGAPVDQFPGPGKPLEGQPVPLEPYRTLDLDKYATDPAYRESVNPTPQQPADFARHEDRNQGVTGPPVGHIWNSQTDIEAATQAMQGDPRIEAGDRGIPVEQVIAERRAKLEKARFADANPTTVAVASEQEKRGTPEQEAVARGVKPETVKDQRHDEVQKAEKADKETANRPPPPPPPGIPTDGEPAAPPPPPPGVVPISATATTGGASRTAVGIGAARGPAPASAVRQGPPRGIGRSPAVGVRRAAEPGIAAAATPQPGAPIPQAKPNLGPAPGQPMAHPGQTMTAPPQTPTDAKNARNPNFQQTLEWALPLMQAGFGMMGGTSPFAAVNIGQGANAGIKAYTDRQQAQATAGWRNRQADLLEARNETNELFRKEQLVGEQRRAAASERLADARERQIEAHANDAQTRTEGMIAAAQIRSDALLGAASTRANAPDTVRPNWVPIQDENGTYYHDLNGTRDDYRPGKGAVPLPRSGAAPKGSAAPGGEKAITWNQSYQRAVAADPSLAYKSDDERQAAALRIYNADPARQQRPTASAQPPKTSAAPQAPPGHTFIGWGNKGGARVPVFKNAQGQNVTFTGS